MTTEQEGEVMWGRGQEPKNSGASEAGKDKRTDFPLKPAEGAQLG